MATASCFGEAGASMTSPYRGCGTSRLQRRIARVRMVVVVGLLTAARSQAPLAQSSPLDTTPPSVTITAPAAGTRVGRNVTIAATVSDAVGVASVTFLVDGTAIGTDTKPPYSVRWNTRGVADGSHTLRAEARDRTGNVGTSAPVSVSLGSATDTTPPAVSLTSPAGGAQVTGTVAIAATASDAVGVTSVTFLVDGAAIATDTSSPYTASWSTTSVAAGSHTIRAEARDAAGNVGTSAAVSVTVTVPSAPRPTTAVFEPSADHSSVLRYVLDVFPSGSNPAATTPTATRDLGKPSVVNGEITADISPTTASLAPATYIATVSAVTSSSSARSAPSPAFVIASSTTSLTIAMPASTTPAAAASHGVLWVTNSSTHMVAAFDATTGDVLATIPVGLTPTGIAVAKGAGKVYVADEGSDTVSVISKATMTRSATIPLPPPFGRKPHHVSGSPDGRFIYVGELGANVVDVIDTATDQISARFGTGWPGSKTRVVVPDPSGTVLYAVNRGAAGSPSTLVALEAETGHWLWQMPIDGDPSDFLIAPDGRTGILTRETDSTIELIDLERRAVMRALVLGAGYDAGTVQLTLDNRLLLITPGTMPEAIGAVDVAAMAALAPVSLAGPASGAALSAGRLSYACVPESSEFQSGVVAVDARSRTVVRRYRFPGGGSPHTVLYDPD
jgi:YVTN family beta-propeller protein